ncbi:MAG: hypothetical protein K6A80_08740 [Saccharofermentans sp.]|nr:hypothetical protein [Saccharofermentans sp.]
MKKLAKGLILLAVIIYVVSPVDAAPGPIDDLLVMAIAMASNKALTDVSSYDDRDADYW